MATRIITKNGSGAPLASDLQQGELAVDLTNKRLYTEDSLGAVQEIGVNPTSLTTGTFTSTGIDDNATSTAITIDSNENVGIGTSSPTLSLSVDGNIWQGNAGGVEIGRITNAEGWYDFGGSSNVNGAQMSHNSTLRFLTNSAERMRIDSSGNVGIGTSSPSKQLEVQNAAAGTAIRASNNGGGYAELACTSNATSTAELNFTNSLAMLGGNVGIGTSSPTADLEISSASNPEISIASTAGATSNFLNFKAISHTQQIQTQLKTVDNGDFTSDLAFLFKGTGTGGALSEKMRIDASGNLLVGTTSTDRTASTGITLTTSGFIDISRSGTIAGRFTRKGTDGSVIDFRKESAAVGSISLTASGTAYNTSSDQRLKENIADADDAGDKIDAIQVRQYDWKVDGSHQKYGMIAQELQLVAPEAVSGDAGSEEMMGVDYSKLVPMLIKEIQSLRNRVAQLEEE